MVVFTICLLSGFSNRLGRKPAARQENAIAKSTIMVVRVAEVVELGAKPKLNTLRKGLRLELMLLL